MKRRDLLAGAGLAALGAGLAACSRDQGAASDAADDAAPRQWKMVTSWPANYPGLGSGAADLARMITEATGGRISVKVFAGGELVPPFEVFDAVSRGTAEMGHSAAYYWKGKAEAAPFFCAVPFGFNAQEMNGWLDHGGGLELWRELYAQFDLVPFPAGNTGVQMTGWFKKEVRSINDFKGLKIRVFGSPMHTVAMDKLNATGVPMANSARRSCFSAAATHGTWEWSPHTTTGIPPRSEIVARRSSLKSSPRRGT